jgi:hypothetical protein
MQNSPRHQDRDQKRGEEQVDAQSCFRQPRLAIDVRALKADEKNMGAIPMAGTGLALMMPHGSSRATAGTKEQIATMRRARCWSAC